MRSTTVIAIAIKRSAATLLARDISVRYVYLGKAAQIGFLITWAAKSRIERLVYNWEPRVKIGLTESENDVERREQGNGTAYESIPRHW